MYVNRVNNDTRAISFYCVTNSLPYTCAHASRWLFYLVLFFLLRSHITPATTWTNRTLERKRIRLYSVPHQKQCRRDKHALFLPYSNVARVLHYRKPTMLCICTFFYYARPHTIRIIFVVTLYLWQKVWSIIASQFIFDLYLNIFIEKKKWRIKKKRIINNIYASVK